MRIIAFIFKPIIPKTCEKIERMLNYSSDNDKWGEIGYWKEKYDNAIGDLLKTQASGEALSGM